MPGLIFIIEQSAIASVQKEYQALGVNLDKKQTDYILLAGVKMLGVAMVSMLAAILITLLSAKVAAELGKVVREKVYKIILSHADIKKFNHFNSTPVGYRYQISFSIFVDGNLSTFDSHEIADKLEDEIIEKIPSIYLVVIHVNPV